MSTNLQHSLLRGLSRVPECSIPTNNVALLSKTLKPMPKTLYTTVESCTINASANKYKRPRKPSSQNPFWQKPLWSPAIELEPCRGEQEALANRAQGGARLPKPLNPKLQGLRFRVYRIYRV